MTQPEEDYEKWRGRATHFCGALKYLKDKQKALSKRNAALLNEIKALQEEMTDIDGVLCAMRESCIHKMPDPHRMITTPDRALHRPIISAVVDGQCVLCLDEFPYGIN
jgi:hypothetical protein